MAQALIWNPFSEKSRGTSGNADRSMKLCLRHGRRMTDGPHRTLRNVVCMCCSAASGNSSGPR